MNVIYLDSDFEPTTKDKADMIKFFRDDGSIVFGKVVNESSSKEKHYFDDLMLITQKTIGQVVTSYDDNLSNLVYDGLNRRVDFIDMRRAHKAMIRSYALKVYLEGLRQGGIEDADIDEEDQAHIDEAVADWIASQVPHVDGFARDTIDAGKDDGARKQILDRKDIWVGALRTLGELGRAYALKNERGQWVMGATEEHCETCLRLSKGKTHRLSWFVDRGYVPRQAGSETLECGGWNCDCSIVSKSGKVLL